MVGQDANIRGQPFSDYEIDSFLTTITDQSLYSHLAINTLLLATCYHVVASMCSPISSYIYSYVGIYND